MKEPVDPRSTWRKRLRKVLLQEGRDYVCVECRRTNKHDGELVDGLAVAVPEDARYFPGIGSLQANHRNKCLEDIDPVNGEWLCASCHKVLDTLTAPGVSGMGSEYGYGFDIPSPPVGNDG